MPATAFVCALWGLIIGLLYLRVPPSPDNAVFDYIGWSMLNGARPYVDVVEHNFPGQMWLHTISTALFGNHVWSYRILDYLLSTAAGLLLLGMLRDVRQGPCALLVVALYQAMVTTASFWLLGQRDVVVVLFLAAAALAFRTRVRGGSRAWLGLFGFALAYAVLIRPTYALFGVLVVVADLWLGRSDTRRLRTVVADAVVSGGISVGLLAAVVGLGWRSGALAAWYDAAVLYNVQVYGTTPDLLALAVRSFKLLWSWHWYVGFAVLGAWLWWRSGKDRLTWALGVAMAVTAIASAVVQRKGFEYHYGALLGPLALFAGHLIDRSVHAIRTGAPPLYRAAAVAVCLVAIAGTASKVRGALGPQLGLYTGSKTSAEILSRYDTDEAGLNLAHVAAAAEYAAATVPAGRPVLSWTRAVHINFLAGRPSPSRFPTVGMLTLAHEPFPRAAQWGRELARNLADNPPEVIFLPGQPENPNYEPIWNSPTPSPAVNVLREVVRSRYAADRSFGSLTAYRLRHDHEFASASR